MAGAWDLSITILGRKSEKINSKSMDFIHLLEILHYMEHFIQLLVK